MDGRRRRMEIRRLQFERNAACALFQFLKVNASWKGVTPSLV